MNWQLLLLEISLYFTSFSLETFLEEFISSVVSLLGGLNQPGHCYFPVLLAILICPRVCQFKVVLPQQNLAFFITIRSHLLPLLEIICINNKNEICIVMNILVEKKGKLLKQYIKYRKISKLIHTQKKKTHQQTDNLNYLHDVRLNVHTHLSGGLGGTQTRYSQRDWPKHLN